MRRFSITLRNGTKTTVRGDRLGLSSEDHHHRPDWGFGDTHPYIQNRNGDTVFVGSFREVAYVADIDAEELPVIPTRDKREEKAGLERWFDLGSKAVAILSGLAVVGFVILIATGHGRVGTVQAESLLTIFAFTLVGGIVSVGGVQLFSVTASLRRAKERVEVIERAVGGGGSGTPVHLVKRMSLSFHASDRGLLSELQAVQGNTLLEDRLVICAAHPEFLAEVDKMAGEQRRDGWALTAITPNDGLTDGLMVNLTFERAL
jgi:hypothetical protein